MKKCSICKIEKDDIKKNRKCKLCNTQYMRKFRDDNKAKIKLYQNAYNKKYYDKNQNDILKEKKKYYIKNKEKIIDDMKEYYLKNKEKKLLYNKAYYKKNKKRIVENVSNYRKLNIDKMKKYVNQYQKDRKNKFPKWKIRDSISSSINIYLKKNNCSKNGKSISKYLQYSIEELKQHLESLFESWMTWENYGSYKINDWNDKDQSTWKWQVDHIIPQSYFKYTSMEDEEFKKCWALENLRPYSAKQNLLDKNRKIL